MRQKWEGAKIQEGGQSRHILSVAADPVGSGQWQELTNTEEKFIHLGRHREGWLLFKTQRQNFHKPTKLKTPEPRGKSHKPANLRTPEPNQIICSKGAAHEGTRQLDLLLFQQGRCYPRCGALICPWEAPLSISGLADKSQGEAELTLEPQPKAKSPGRQKSPSIHGKKQFLDSKDYQQGLFSNHLTILKVIIKQI